MTNGAWGRHRGMGRGNRAEEGTRGDEDESDGDGAGAGYFTGLK